MDKKYLKYKYKFLAIKNADKKPVGGMFSWPKTKPTQKPISDTSNKQPSTGDKPPAKDLKIGSIFVLKREDKNADYDFFVRFNDESERLIVISKIIDTTGNEEYVLLPKREFIPYDDFDANSNILGTIENFYNFPGSEIDQNLQTSYDKRKLMFIDLFYYIHRSQFNNDEIFNNYIDAEYGSDIDNIYYFVKIANKINEFWIIEDEYKNQLNAALNNANEKLDKINTGNYVDLKRIPINEATTLMDELSKALLYEPFIKSILNKELSVNDYNVKYNIDNLLDSLKME